jgi:hypothetical protein
MHWVVVGGQSRSVGKTAAVCGLIAALSDRPWTAVKITQFGHGICSRSGHACDCACEDGDWALSAERNSAGRKDTARFLRAGARRVWWLRTRMGALAQALPALEEQLAAEMAAERAVESGGTEWVICESNSLVALRRPELYLTLLDPAIADFKDSARALLPRADARLIVGAGSGADAISPAAAEALGPAANAASGGAGAGSDVPAFAVAPPTYLSPAVIAFTRFRLAASSGA